MAGAGNLRGHAAQPKLGDNPARCPSAGYRLCDPSILVEGQIQGGVAQGIGWVPTTTQLT